MVFQADLFLEEYFFKVLTVPVFFSSGILK